MKRRKPTEAERLARCNEEMRFALANNCTVIEARRRIARRRWTEFEERQEAELLRIRRCGTAHSQPSEQVDRQPAPAERPEPNYWWKNL